MTRPAIRKAATILSVMTLLAASGCALPNGGRPAGVSPGQVAACRARSEQIYRQQNRADLYQGDTYATSTRDAPFGGAGLPSAGPVGLGAQFGREKALNDCYNSGAGPSDAAPAAAVKP